MSSEAFDYSRDVFALTEKLDGLSTIDEVADALFGMVAQFGAEKLFVSFLPKPDEPPENAVLARRSPDEWFRIYSKERYIDVDPFVQRVKRTSRPFAWHEVIYEPDPRVAELMRLRKDFGLRNGFVIPVHAPHGLTGFVSMGGIDMDIGAQIRPAIHLVALYAFHRARHLRMRHEKTKTGLTAREREILTWTAHGKSAWEIGEILHIAKRTVDEHIQISLRKLHAVNKTQAVAIALRDGLIGI